MITDSQYLRLSGALIYDSFEEVWNETSPSVQEGYLRAIEKGGFAPLLYYAHKELLPEPYRTRFQNDYLERSGRAVQQEIQRDELYRLFETHSVRFAPIKGLDLSYRFYPSPALRKSKDWDILVHPDDFSRMLELIVSHGWAPLNGMPIKVNAWNPNSWSPSEKRDKSHHAPPLFKGNCLLEPHWTLPGFKLIDPHEFWDEIAPVGEGKMESNLSSEFTILMMTRHFANHLYIFGWYKYLFDTAFVLKKNSIDWEKLRALASRWKFPYPGNLLASFPIFFPKDLIGAMCGDPARGMTYQRLFRNRRNFPVASEAQWAVQQAGPWVWLRTHLRRMRPCIVREVACLPEKGAYGRLFAEYVRKITLYLWHILKYRFTKGRRYRSLLEDAEKVEKIQ